MEAKMESLSIYCSFIYVIIRIDICSFNIKKKNDSRAMRIKPRLWTMMVKAFGSSKAIAINLLFYLKLILKIHSVKFFSE